MGFVVCIRAECPCPGVQCEEGTQQRVGFSGLARLGSFQEDGVSTGSEWRGEEEA